MTNTYTGGKKNKVGMLLWKTIPEKFQRKKPPKKRAEDRSGHLNFKIRIQKKQWVGRVYLPYLLLFYSDYGFLFAGTHGCEAFILDVNMASIVAGFYISGAQKRGYAGWHIGGAYGKGNHRAGIDRRA